MPRKKDPPPSSLPPRRSTRGASKSTSLMDGEDAETPMVPEIPRLALGSINKDKFLENSAADGGSLTGKPGFARKSAGLSDPDSSGSPGTTSHTGCGNNPSPVSETGVTAGRPATPLFSPEFKAMWGRDYPRPTTVFSPHVPLSGEVAPSPTVSEGESVSKLPDMHVHVSGSGLETEAEVHGIGENHLVTGVASEVGIHDWHGVHGEVGDDVFPVRDEGMHASTKTVHVGFDELPMQPDEGGLYGGGWD
ncbi:hypothetical protein L1987_04459 [Smallanthus sonchifolius]|uniref:Uncharacterized protein n=1 Tax=Smallanthus sonchifolius TaxID=185202 RepID=A0ACB9JSM8_9ASTR|nr:hypothetical protein L1987_04459 [Smallanthus sonchifolius]